MPTKVGAGGKPQAYGKGGKYTKSTGSTRTLPNGADPEQRAELMMTKYRDISTVLETHRQKILETYPKPGEGLEVRSRVSLEFIERIVSEGMKPQHETGSSNGTFNPAMRKRIEQTMFSAPDTDPVYGYIPVTYTGWVSDRQRYYGAASIVFKPEVLERTTVTFGDSLYEGREPAPVHALDVHTASAPRLMSASTEPGGPSYVEAQIHGPVTPSDIAKIIVRDTEYNRDNYTHVLDGIRDRGIEVEWAEIEDNSFGLDPYPMSVLT